MSAVVLETDDGPAVRFRLTNVSDEVLRVYPFDLPWGNPNAVQYAAIASTGETLPVIWPVADPSFEHSESVKPGDTIEGQTLLRSRIIRLDEARATADIIVTWCYRFGQIGEQTGGRLSGLVVVAKRAV